MCSENKKTFQRLQLLPLPHEARSCRVEKFALIVPPSPFVVPCGWEWVHSAPFEGPSIISTIVRGLGYNFTLIDAREDFDIGSLSGELQGCKYIGIATYEDNFPFIKRACEIARSESPDSIIILGGPLVTSVPELILENTKADFAVIGEGELTIIELMDFLSGSENTLPVESIRGLAWKNTGGEVIINEKRPQIADLDVVPFQDFSCWKKFDGKIPEIYLSSSRGCHYNCTFCYRPFPLLRLKSVERVKREIEYLRKYNFNHVWWNDLCFINGRERTEELLKKVFSSHMFTWNCFSRVTDVDIEILRLMKEKNCNIILYGFEAISEEILDSYRKGISKNDMIKAIELTREAGLKVGGLFIVGAPGETRESLERIVAFCREFREITRVKYLSALPGTQLYKWALEKGCIGDPLSHLSFLARERSVEEDIDEEGFLLMSDEITREDLRKAYRAVNSGIEKRPFNYTEEENVFLNRGRKFQIRPVFKGG